MRPPRACPSGRLSRPSARPTSSSRNWSARQRCQPSSSPAAASAPCDWFSSLSSISRPCSLRAWRSAAAAPALALPCPWAISCSSLVSASCTLCTAWARTSGSILGFCGLLKGSAAAPRRARSSSAQTGTAGRAAAASAAAATVCASASRNDSQTTKSCPREVSSRGGKRASTLGQLPSVKSAPACTCQWSTSICKACAAACASRQDLVERTSMRCASNTAASRCTCTRCCRSSMPLTRSLSWLLRVSRGSRLRGAPALAASRCQAMASAMLSLGLANQASPLSAHSWAIDSCARLRLISSSFSRSNLAAPLSLALSSLKTACMSSGLGSRASQSRMRPVRSLEVGAEKAPPVSRSRWCASGWAPPLAGTASV